MGALSSTEKASTAQNIAICWRKFGEEDHAGDRDRDNDGACKRFFHFSVGITVDGWLIYFFATII